MRNPFKPSFGVDPPLLVGRELLLDEFSYGLESGPGSAARASLYTGARGAGKTVLLNAIEDLAKEHGWVTLSETASKGLVERMTQSRLPQLFRDFDLHDVKRHLSHVRFPVVGGGVSWETIESHIVEDDLRGQINLLTDVLAEQQSGLLITVDEVHAAYIDDLRELITVIQHAFREDREIAFAAAGLQASISDILQEDVITFLRRADQHHLGPVDLEDVKRALKEPINRNQRTVSDEALEIMAEGTQGYPFLIQLIGDRCWRRSEPEPEITIQDAIAGVAESRKRLGSVIHAPALKGVTNVGKLFLVAMARDDGASRTNDIAERLGESIKYVGVYRARLIDMELITPAGHGYVDFTLPYLRDYLREHAVSEIEPFG